MPDFDRFVECVLLSDFSCFKPGEKMIWGTSLPLKGLIAHLHTYMIGGVDSGWIGQGGGEYMHECGGVQEEDYKFNSMVILDSDR